MEAGMNRTSRGAARLMLAFAVAIPSCTHGQQPITWTKPGSVPATTTAPGTISTVPPVTPAVSPASSPEAPTVMMTATTPGPEPVAAAPRPITTDQELARLKLYAPVAGKKNKFEYIGPRTVVELPAVPMLDAEGRQRLDPDGKPMFKEPIRQQRDKHGNPLFDDAGKPMMQTEASLGYDEKGGKLRVKKVKPPKTVSVSIERGTLTVDGMTGKAGLNYEIKDLKFLYLYAPWIGTTIVSTEPFPGAQEQKNAFNDKTLTVQVSEHSLQLYSDKRLLGKKPQSAFVAIDRSFKLPATFPLVGYGHSLKAPYVWPGSGDNAMLHGPVAPPALPASLRAVSLLKPCPAGMMRVSSAVPGQVQTEANAPCTPIGKVPLTTVKKQEVAEEIVPKVVPDVPPVLPR